MTRFFVKVVLLTVFLPSALQAVEGQVISYKSTQDIAEDCVAITAIPGGDYSEKDQKKEQKYCEIDFNDDTLALCPKTWSTSPATMIYDLSESEFTTSSYEASSHCGKKARGPKVSTKVKFKQTMNAAGTSGTFSKSSLMYYHLSRYFDTKTKVPVAVYREMDRKVHRARVSKKGYQKANGSMNKAGWKHMVNAEANPGSYSPTSDLFTESREQIYGVLLKGKGERYGTEFNGTRASGWGAGQNRDFQKTPGFYALRKKADLVEAAQFGLSRAKQDPVMRKDLVNVTDLQVVFWMRELIEITLLDYIFSQQDRVGNIDYQWYWYWLEGDKVKNRREKRDAYKDKARKKIAEIPVPEDIAGFSPHLIQRTNLNDNDAGGRIAYANFAKKTKMLEKLSHYSAKVYNRLMDLDKDLQAQGPIYQWLSNDLSLTARRLKQVVSNTHLAANLLRAQCEGLRFDLDDVDNFLRDGAREETVDCSQ